VSLVSQKLKFTSQLNNLLKQLQFGAKIRRRDFSYGK